MPNLILNVMIYEPMVHNISFIGIYISENARIVSIEGCAYPTLARWASTQLDLITKNLKD